MIKEEEFLVSVIIPVYNAEKYLTKAVESALLQPETGEVILVEDASTDKSFVICKSLVETNEKVKLIRHPNEKNKGAAASRNLGILYACNPYIAFLDADDFYLPDRFKRAKNLLLSNINVDGVYEAVGFHFYSNEIKERIEKNGKIEKITLNEAFPSDKLFEKMAPIGTCGFFCTDGIIIRKQVFQIIGLFNTKLRMSQDTEMWMRMAAKCNLVAGEISNPVAMYGIHSQNRIHNKDSFEFYFERLFLHFLKWALINDISYERINLVMQKYLYVSYKFKPSKISNFKAIIRLVFIFPGSLKYPVVKNYIKTIFYLK